MNKQKSSNEYQKAKQYLTRLLAQSSRTVWEAERKLTQKKFSIEIVKRVISEFAEAGFLDDEKYIRDWLFYQLKYRPAGRRLCFEKLRARGLSVELVNRILDEFFSPEKELEIAENLMKKKINFYRHFNARKKAQKIILFLKSRGFTDETIVKILTKLNLPVLDNNFSEENF